MNETTNMLSELRKARQAELQALSATDQGSDAYAVSVGRPESGQRASVIFHAADRVPVVCFAKDAIPETFGHAQ